MRPPSTFFSGCSSRCATAPSGTGPTVTSTSFSFTSGPHTSPSSSPSPIPSCSSFFPAPHFRFYDVLWPIHSPLQPKINLAGAAALYLLLVVFVSSLLRTRIGRPLWRNLHYLVFPAAALLLLHSILTDPNLKDGHPDLLDGGKIFVEAASLVSFLAVAARVYLRGRGLRPPQIRPAAVPNDPPLPGEIS